jgi:transcriptional regulator with XRE-family HTH domain
MHWREKIKKLLEGRNASQLAITVGLHKSAIRDASNTGRLPRVDKAIKIARALDVPCDWLFNDGQDWPAPEGISAASLSEMELIQEVARRRELVRRDIRAWDQRFTEERLDGMNCLAAKDKLARTDEEQATLDAGLSDLIQSLSLHNRLTWLDADKLFPPDGVLELPYGLGRGRGALHEAFLGATHQIPHIADAFIATKVFEVEPAPGVIAYHTSDGSAPPGVEKAKPGSDSKRPAGSRRKGSVIGSPQKRKPKGKGKRGRKR